MTRKKKNPMPTPGPEKPSDESAAPKSELDQKLEFMRNIEAGAAQLIGALRAPREAALARTKFQEFLFWTTQAILIEDAQAKHAGE